MPRYEVQAIICIDAKDEDDLTHALKEVFDDEDGVSIPPWNDKGRYMRVYASPDDQGKIQAEVVDESFGEIYGEEYKPTGDQDQLTTH